MIGGVVLDMIMVMASTMAHLRLQTVCYLAFLLNFFRIHGMALNFPIRRGRWIRND